MTKKSHGLEAPFAAADAVGYAIDLSFDKGLKNEREGFLKLVASDQPGCRARLELVLSEHR
ncbi:hypothetical protein ACVWWI_006640 [Bradyrhizobium sp. USDA 3686]|nr:hypothetical protein [Bradyrhizobium canariense]